MRLTAEDTRDEVTIRVLACECEPGCDTRFAAFQARHAQLWVVLIMSTDEEVWGEIDLLWGETGITDLPGLIEQYLALVGMTWPALQDEGACSAQLVVADAMPGWMLRLDAGMVWRTRRCVFGNDLVRVPRALKALHGAYTPDAPALETWLR